MPDPYDLERFVEAQEGVYPRALAELRAGRKTSHWMWFVFPQVAGLGSSPMSARYAITGIAEAKAYLEHPVLGPRLLECTRALLDQPSADAQGILGSVDALKLRSCLTLFEQAAGTESAFARALERFYGGRRDQRTLDLVA
jgi:uncharacterized protein (DUF1810 family)